MPAEPRSVIYIFSIALTQLSEGTPLGTAYFPTLVDGMFCSQKHGRFWPAWCSARSCQIPRFSLLFHACFFQGLPDLARLCFQAQHAWHSRLLLRRASSVLLQENFLYGLRLNVASALYTWQSAGGASLP